jgi:hypothetical protein
MENDSVNLKHFNILVCHSFEYAQDDSEWNRTGHFNF